MNAYDIARCLMERPDGATVRSDGSLPNQGVAVAITEALVTDGPDVWNTTLFVYDHADEADAFGIWRDDATGKFYVDAVILCTTLEMAIALATAHNQIAVFDLYTMSEVRI
jgi:hypothetical protein